MPSKHPIAQHLRRFNAEIAILSLTVGTLAIILTAILTR
jgi:hypothetical protein